MKQQVKAVESGWSHDCREVWYFRGDSRPDAEKGESVLLNLTNIRPDGAYDGVIEEETLKGVVTEKINYTYGYYLCCKDIRYGDKLFTATAVISDTRERSDSVKLVPQN